MVYVITIVRPAVVAGLYDASGCQYPTKSPFSDITRGSWQSSTNRRAFTSSSAKAEEERGHSTLPELLPSGWQGSGPAAPSRTSLAVA